MTLLPSFLVRHRPNSFRSRTLGPLSLSLSRPATRRATRQALHLPPDLTLPKTIRHPLLLEPRQVPMPMCRRHQKRQQQMDGHAAPAYADNHAERELTNLCERGSGLFGLFGLFGPPRPTCFTVNAPFQDSFAPDSSIHRRARRISRRDRAVSAAPPPRSHLSACSRSTGPPRAHRTPARQSDQASTPAHCPGQQAHATTAPERSDTAVRCAAVSSPGMPESAVSRRLVSPHQPSSPPSYHMYIPCAICTHTPVLGSLLLPGILVVPSLVRSGRITSRLSRLHRRRTETPRAVTIFV